MEEEYIPFKKAAEYLGILEKFLINYSKEGKELDVVKIKNRNKISKVKLDEWKKKRDFSYVVLNEEEYLRALTFSLKKFYSGAPLANFATSQQREAGKYISDHVSGFLGEVAFRKFMFEKFQVDLKLDSNVDGIVRSQDIVSVSRRKGVENQPNFKIGIKSTKEKNVWLIVGEKEVDLADRTSDYYVMVRVGLYPNHFVRLVRDNAKLEALKDIIPPLVNINSYIVGFCHKKELEGPVKKVGTQDISPSYVKHSGGLRTDWEFIAKSI